MVIFSAYKTVQTLGRNAKGGRVTYLAQKGDRQVVVKQFQFATGASWAELKEIEREVSILKSLDHPGIPKYIESFEADNGFCLVQEYIAAPSLSEGKPRSLEQVKAIAIQVLDILVYLQGLHPSVLHRDIKPENILCNEQGQVWLVDFGLSRLGNANVAASSMVVGTIGFIPPELFAGRELSKASDLYSLGATLLALINGVPSYQMNSLINDDFAFFDEAFCDTDEAFQVWLQQMVAVRASDRFKDARCAREGFPSQLVRDKAARMELLDSIKGGGHFHLDSPGFIIGRRLAGIAAVILFFKGALTLFVQYQTLNPAAYLFIAFLVGITDSFLIMLGMSAPLLFTFAMLPTSKSASDRL
jgi:serine/threonine protein kinase